MNKSTFRKIGRIIKAYLALAIPALIYPDHDLDVFGIITTFFKEAACSIGAVILAGLATQVVIMMHVSMFVMLATFGISVIILFPIVQSPINTVRTVWNLLPDGDKEKRKNKAENPWVDTEESDASKRYYVGEDGELVENQYAGYEDQRRFL